MQQSGELSREYDDLMAEFREAFYRKYVRTSKRVMSE